MALHRLQQRRIRRQQPIPSTNAERRAKARAAKKPAAAPAAKPAVKPAV